MLNALDGTTYDVQEAGTTTTINLYFVNHTSSDYEGSGTTYGQCGTSLDNDNGIYCSSKGSGGGWAFVNSTHRSTIPSTATIGSVMICWNGYFDTKSNDAAGDSSYVRVGENSTGSWAYTNVASCVGTACNFYTETDRCYNVTTTINTPAKATDIRIALWHNEADDANQDIFDDYAYVNITYSETTYRAEVWHNSTAVSYSGTLNSVNVTLNFTTTQTDNYNMSIFNFSSGNWIGCASGSVTANTPTRWWCNMTNTPSDFISAQNTVRISINATPDGDQGTLKEDYVQYYVSFTSFTPSYAFTVTVLGQPPTYSNETNYNATPDIYFNISSANAAAVYPCANADYATNCQTGTLPIFNYTNTGNVAINLTLNFSSALPSGIEVYGNSSARNGTAYSTLRLINNTCEGGCFRVAQGLNFTNNWAALWLWANFTNVVGGNAYSRVLRHYSNGSI
jgi:hypothetical protein